MEGREKEMDGVPAGKPAGRGKGLGEVPARREGGRRTLAFGRCVSGEGDEAGGRPDADHFGGMRAFGGTDGFSGQVSASCGKVVRERVREIVSGSGAFPSIIRKKICQGFGEALASPAG